ncbi:hypothetical protein MPER_12566 [Moniliophthora perniciosa FA553]|nr:hypothetical protein MPER_12566 [Moniliophthora perniciosa FA553]
MHTGGKPPPIPKKPHTSEGNPSSTFVNIAKDDNKLLENIASTMIPFTHSYSRAEKDDGDDTNEATSKESENPIPSNNRGFNTAARMQQLRRSGACVDYAEMQAAWELELAQRRWASAVNEAHGDQSTSDRRVASELDCERYIKKAEQSAQLKCPPRRQLEGCTF